MIKAAIFDMDGLLIDSEPLWQEAFKKAFKQFGVNIAKADMLETRGRRQAESIAYLLRKFKVQDASIEVIHERLNEDMKSLIKDGGKLLPGAQKALDVCCEAKLKMAIASSSAMTVIDAVVDQFNLRHYFEDVYSGSAEPFGKPHPGLFINVAKELGVEPRHCLVFEDAPFGVLAAKAAHMKCIAVPEREIKFHAFIQTADIVLQSLEQFDEKMLKSLK